MICNQRFTVIKSICLLTMAITLIACNGQQNNSKKQDKIVTINGKRQFSEDDVNALVSGFCDAVLNKDYQKAITYFAPEYVSLQLGDVLDNRVNQFIGEYLWGEYTDSFGAKKGISPNPDNITGMKILSVSAETDYYSACVEIKLDNGIKYVTELSISVEYVNSVETLTLYGAFG